MKIYPIVLLFLIFQTSVRGNSVVVTLYAIELQASPFYLGLVVAATSLFPMLSAAYAGRLSDLLGYRLLFSLGTIGTGMALLVPYLFPNQLLFLLISQLLFGLFQILTLVTVQNLVGALSNEETRTHNYSVFSLGVSVSNLLGPMLTGFSIDHVNFVNTYLILGIVSIIPGIIVGLHTIPLPKLVNVPVNEDKRNSKDLIFNRSLRKTFIISGVILTGVGMYEFYFPIYANEISISASMIGLIISCNAVAYIVSRLAMNTLIKRFKEQSVLGGCLVISAGAFFLIPLFTSPVSLMIISFIMGLGLGCCQPLSIVMAYNSSPQGRTGEVLGLRLTVNKTVQFLLPLILGPFGGLIGFLPVFWSNTFLLMFSGYYCLRYPDRTKKEHG